MSLRTRRFLLILPVVLSLFWINASHATETSAPLIFGIHPYLPTSELHTRFQPLADYLGKTLGRRVEIRIGRDYADHIHAVGSNEVDIAFLGPSLYVKVVREYGPHPLLARLEVNGKPELFGAIIVRNDSPIHALAELKGHSFAFGDPDSTMSHIVPEAMLAAAGVPVSALSGHKFLGAHKNVALGVLAGDFDAGGVKSEVFDEYAQRGLRLLAKSAAVSEHLLVVRPNMPRDQVEKLRQALLTLKAQPKGGQIMTSITKGMTAFVPVVDSDYDNLRTLMQALEPK